MEKNGVIRFKKSALKLAFMAKKCDYKLYQQQRKKRGSEKCVNAERKKMVQNVVRRKKPW